MKTALTITICFLALHIQAQFILSQNIQKAQDYIMDMRFSEARTLLKAEQKNNPTNGFIPYLYSNIIFIRTLVTDNEKYYDSNIDSIKQLVKAVKNNGQDTSFFYRYCLSEMNFELGAIHMQFGHSVKSAWSMIDAFKLIKENRSAPMKFLPQQMADGLLNVAMGSLPGKYKYLAGLIGYSGDIKKGMAQLKRATKTEGTTYNCFAKKFAFVYGYAHSFLDEDKTFNIWDLIPGYQESPLLLYLQARIYKDRGGNERLIELLQSREKKNRYPFYYLDYMLGKAKLNRLDPDADASFLIFLSKYPGQNYIKSTHRYLMWHYYLRGNKKQSEYHRQLGLTSGESTLGADQQAIADLEKPINDALLKSQLLFDGGYYRQAVKELVRGADNFKTESERIEFHYRMGRIYQHMEEYTQALLSYKNVFLYSASENTFEGANAALQSGIINEGLEKFTEAEKFYQLTLSYTGFPFEDGLHQKAKAGLARVEQK